MVDQLKFLKEQGYKPASEMAEIIFQAMLQKEKEGDLSIVRNYKPEEIEKLLARKIELLAVERSITIKYFSLILGDPNNPKERRLFVMQENVSAGCWDLWERREDEFLPFFNPLPPMPTFHFRNRSFSDLLEKQKHRREIML